MTPKRSDAPSGHHRITVRLPVDVYEQLRAAAYAQRTNMGSVVTNALRRDLAPPPVLGRAATPAPDFTIKGDTAAFDKARDDLARRLDQPRRVAPTIATPPLDFDGDLA